MNTGIYTTNPQDTVLNHWPVIAKLIKDGYEPQARLVDAQVRSGDYFITLATLLDVLAQDNDLSDNKLLQKAISDLLYLQNNYNITKKITK